VAGIETLCAAYIELADAELPADTKTGVPVGWEPRWAIGRLGAVPVPIPTRPLAVDPSGQYGGPGTATVAGFGAGFQVVGGMNLPKIIECVGSDGQVYRQLVKGRDDVRQDAVVEQVFALVDQMLRAAEGARAQGLRIRTYRIIPLHALAGLLEWVPDTVPLGEWVLPAHELHRPADLEVKAARARMKAAWEQAGGSVAGRLHAYQEVCARFRPVLRHFFWETARGGPADWWARRSRYVASCAATSMLGHVVGLGDRHCQNILLDRKTGDLVQIDLNMIFELGQSLRVPERVPFRMTRDIVDGMGPAGTRGGFSRAAEETLRLLRRQASTVLTILEVFKHDPLYRWSLNPIKLARMQADAGARLGLAPGPPPDAAPHGDAPPEADRALLRVREKLLGFEAGGVQLSEPGQVRFLLQVATAEENLSQMYVGWQPWV
jgi:ataxia telangiectasia mutated family protein